MEKILILVVCAHEEILQTIIRLINVSDQWTALGAATQKTALVLFEEHRFTLVLLGSGMDDATEKMLSSFFLEKNPGVKIVQHYGGGSGLLFNEIHSALAKN
jgi:hypothetical protein